MLKHMKCDFVRRLLTYGLLLVALTLTTFALAPAQGIVHAAGPAVTGLHVQGNGLVNGNGQTIRLLGVNHSGTEFACIQGHGIFDGQTDDNAIAAMAAWHINAVRVPLNEDCWLNINGVNPSYGGSNYQQAIADYVNRLNNHGLAVILDLHWNAPGSQQATGQQPMPDQDHAPGFWSSVASYFKGNSAVIFDLYNEPFPDNNQDTTAGWRCWRDGGTCSGVSFQVAGMQQLVNVVRQTGASNVIMLGGLEYSNALSQWLTYKPNDPNNNLVASWHSYNFNLCNNQSCWDNVIAPLARQVPVITGEMGENDCAHGYIDGLMPWLDSHGISYLGWTWNTWDCSSGPALITDYSGTPTNFGVGLRDHLASLAGGGGGGSGGPVAGKYYKIVNQNSGKLLAVSGMSQSDGAQVTQWNDNGTPDHNWQFVDAGGGYYKIVNQYSGKLLAVSGMSQSDGANVTQWNDNGTPDHLWRLVDAGGGYYKIVNKNSGKLLAVSGMSQSDGANVTQWNDNGTPDHNWRLAAV